MMDSYEKHDSIADYIEHVKHLVAEAECLVGLPPFEWLLTVLGAEQKFHRNECERIITEMEDF